MTEEPLCGGCGLLRSDHVKDKCLFIPTDFKEMVCQELVSYDEATDTADRCTGKIMGINTPTLNSDERWISWRCTDCGMRGDKQK